MCSPPKGPRTSEFQDLIRISITPDAFEAIAGTLQVGSVGDEPKVSAKGERLIWLEASALDRLRAVRRPGESYSDVILRLAHLEANGT
jgi:hypothetical protein